MSSGNKFVNAVLPMFYLFSIGCLIYAGFFFYNKSIEQKKMLLEIEKRITIDSTGSSYTLPFKDDVNKEEVTYTVGDSSVVEVKDDGSVVAVGEGTTTITVSDGNDRVQTVVVSVGEDAIEETEDEDYVDDLIEDVEEELEDEPEYIEVESITLDKTQLTMKYGDAQKVVARVTPTNATNKDITWTSSNTNLLTVDQSGNLKVVKNESGIVIVTATVDGNHSASVTVKVEEAVVKVSGIKLNKNSVQLKYNSSDILEATVEPSNATNKDVVWVSSNPSLVTVDEHGAIKAVGNANGTATITVTTKDGNYKATAKVVVTKVETTVKVNGVSLNKTNVSLNYNKGTTLIATVSPANAANKNVVWTSSNSKLVTVDQNGKIKAVSNMAGSATITVETKDGGFKATAKVTVVPQTVKVKGISLNKTALSLKHNETAKLSATVSPADATNKTVVWTSSNSNLVSVDQNGNIKVNKNENGTVTITATTKDGNYSASAKITVVQTAIKVTSVKVSPSTVSLNYGETETLTATISPSNATNKKVTWSSSDSDLVSVSNTGKIKAVGNKNASATITVTTADGKYKASVKVTVKQKVIKVTKIKLSKTKVNLAYGGSVSVSATVSPSNATNKDVTWSSSNTALATVDKNGKITAKKGTVGIATITAKTADGGYTASVTVNVYPTGDYVNFKNSYSKYKTNILLKRTNSVMQSFAMSDGYLYISQQQGTTDYAHLSKVKMSDVSNKTGAGQPFQNKTALLKNFGHVAQIDIEETGGKKYLWTGCSTDGAEQPYQCRILLSSIGFKNTTAESFTFDGKNNVKIKGSTLFAVDSENRIAVVMTGTRRTHTFTTYNLDDYIKNKGDTKAIFTFTAKHQDPQLISRQGLDVVGNYIYSYEGNTTYNTENGPAVYLSIWTLQGEKVVYRRKISYPSNSYDWEPEGLKVYGNNIYIGFARIDKSASTKTAYVYKLN